MAESEPNTTKTETTEALAPRIKHDWKITTMSAAFRRNDARLDDAPTVPEDLGKPLGLYNEFECGKCSIIGRTYGGEEPRPEDRPHDVIEAKMVLDRQRRWVRQELRIRRQGKWAGEEYKWCQEANRGPAQTA